MAKAKTPIERSVLGTRTSLYINEEGGETERGAKDQRWINISELRHGPHK